MKPRSGGFLLALVFVAVGLGLSLDGSRALLLYVRSSHWQKVPARIVRVEMQVGRQDSFQEPNEGRPPNRIDGAYEYSFNGQPYVGTRVLIGGAKGEATFVKSVYERMESACRAGTHEKFNWRLVTPASSAPERFILLRVAQRRRGE